MGVAVADVWDTTGDVASRQRIAIPVPADRTPATTTRVAVTIARQAGLGIEFVDAAATADHGYHEEQVRHRCDDAAAEGAPRTSWRVIDGGPEDIGPYITWSGADLRCIGVFHRRRPSTAAESCTVPLLVVGPAWRPAASDHYARVVGGLAGSSGQSEHVARTAAALAERLRADLTLIEVIAPGRDRVVDVPASAHLYWIANGLSEPCRRFDTVPANRPASGLGHFLDVGTVVVVGAPSHHRHILGGVAGRLVQRSPCPVLVVPALTPGTCCTGADRRSRSHDGTRRRAAPTSRG